MGFRYRRGRIFLPLRHRQAHPLCTPVSYTHLDIISRFNLYTSMKVMVAPASGYTSGQALAALAEVAKENLPAGYTYELGGMAREEAQSSGSTTGLIFILCFVFVYLLLSAQYESYILPLAVLLSLSLIHI